jgi:hypothetical protein
LGRIAAFNPLWPSFLVLYDDGDCQWEDLTVASVRLPPEHVKARSLPTLRPAAASKLRAAAAAGQAGAALKLAGADGACASRVQRPRAASGVLTPALRAHAPLSPAAVGYTVDVSLSPRGGWLRAQIASFEPRTRKHLLLYPRDGEEWLDMEAVVAVRVVAATAGAPLQPPEPARTPTAPPPAAVASSGAPPDDQDLLDEMLSVLPVDVVWSTLQSVIEGL